VSEAAVIGVQLEDGTESIKAFVVRTADTLSVEDLLAHCRRYLASYKVPKYVEFRTELPRSILGKTLHRLLRVEERTRLHLQRS
jgi:long-chain acyl-CoA synthetase